MQCQSDHSKCRTVNEHISTVFRQSHKKTTPHWAGIQQLCDHWLEIPASVGQQWCNTRNAYSVCKQLLTTRWMWSSADSFLVSVMPRRLGCRLRNVNLNNAWQLSWRVLQCSLSMGSRPAFSRRRPRPVVLQAKDQGQGKTSGLRGQGQDQGLWASQSWSLNK